MISQILQKYQSIIKFSMVGVLNTFVDFIIFIFLNRFLGIYYIISQVGGYSGGIINSFILNKKWTFKKSTSKNTIVQILLFSIINLISLNITLIVMKILVSSLNINIIISKVLVTIIAQIINFTGSKYLVFN